MSTTITLSLISHTNVGKTTLARTLLRRDVGEVADEAHVTESSDAYRLIETADATLLLWDTPGFGDTRRLIDRLRRETNPLGWLLHQVWDRVADRPLFCSQRAVQNVKEEADVVLYLVSAAEHPDHAGYVTPELEILTWMERPVLLLLNQIDDDPGDAIQSWREFAGRWPIVREVLPLDAFSRSWLQEGALLSAVVGLLPEAKQGPMQELAAAWSRYNVEIFELSCHRMAAYLARAACDREAQAGRGDTSAAVEIVSDLARAIKGGSTPAKQARAALNRRLDQATFLLMEQMIADHGLLGASVVAIEKRVQDFQIKGGLPFDERSGAVAGAVVSGALGGLAADVLSGGLTLGGGMIAGGILGALGGSALARGYRLVAGDREPFVRWTDEFLDTLCRQAVLRYLTVAHHGRGQGRFRDLAEPGHWAAAVDAALEPRRTRLHEIWNDAETAGPENTDAVGEALDPIFDQVLRSVLRKSYPGAEI